MQSHRSQAKAWCGGLGAVRLVIVVFHSAVQARRVQVGSPVH